MKVPYYMVRDADSVINGVMWHDDPDEGPVNIQQDAPEGVTLVAGGADFVRAEYYGGFIAKYVNGAVEWSDGISLAERVEAAMLVTYSDIDKIYADCVGNRTEEYKDAETDARAFAAAGYAGDTTVNVSSFAARNPTGQVQTNEWAAKQIIAQADAYSTAKVAMRQQRFDTQADLREAVDLAGLDLVMHNWGEFIAAMRMSLKV